MMFKRSANAIHRRALRTMEPLAKTTLAQSMEPVVQGLQQIASVWIDAIEPFAESIRKREARESSTSSSVIQSGTTRKSGKTSSRRSELRGSVNTIPKHRMKKMRPR